ncbi:unknown [Corallococcus sp. CAG:1435]|nr:unknown [Corallococcus sp. CAG:1435]
MEEYRFLLQIQPDYIDCQDDSILQPIIDSISKDLSKTKRIAMGKEKVKALFKYDKTYPRWVRKRSGR